MWWEIQGARPSLIRLNEMWFEPDLLDPPIPEWTPRNNCLMGGWLVRPWSHAGVEYPEGTLVVVFDDVEDTQSENRYHGCLVRIPGGN
jgi:hypothetical protein